MNKTEVLIVGAGPTGLVMALWLTRQGIKVRITDRAERTATTSRALAVHARTLELYRQLDLGDQLVALGHPLGATNIWTRGVHRFRIPFGHFGMGLTPYPFILIVPQDSQEKLLEGRLKEVGVEVERNLELVDYVEADSGVVARFRDPRKRTPLLESSEMTNEIQTYEAAYIIGCDGAHSAVRRTTEIKFTGETYGQVFFVADIEGQGPAINGEGHVQLDGEVTFLTLAYDSTRHARLIGNVDAKQLARIQANKDITDVTFEDIATATPAMQQMMKIDRVNWFTTYRVHHRVADFFRRGRAFLVGDAAHIHSPVGGQGLNTGVGDAINLAWKLAAVLQRRADSSLLDSYEAERRAFALTLVETTDSAFNALSARSWLANILRSYIIPFVLKIAVNFSFVRRRIFFGLSQTKLQYRNSLLSFGSAGSVEGGDRLPWVSVGGVDNFDSLKEITWQVHVYGEASVKLDKWCQMKNIPLHQFSWQTQYGRAGFAPNAAYLIRPDMYVAVAEVTGNPGRFDTYFRDVKLDLA
ncbi:putative FAD binding monooxygenase [Aspergillus homomorphus CBS 101889]|uniref:2-polyprenyl-6-methoxyphenol hydroxylase n=1 Tax=Aspergillus homomorphus (strain CBS 101889) TaxID=1450537 RepID=A0A395HJC8_ASPHC|nr:2-polyprenyl-6-methoxyphenol hydroxylase [Aspergillus homomorphus CBS 101889]RAL07028.1 2-polyprenyl-6-methoxyphenol hydroxylase [Aspergillus homomorphus CBS 101889]